jgi:hypothetical protein
MIDEAAKRSFDDQGYLVASGLFDADEAAFLRDHFTLLREAGPIRAISSEPTWARTIR